MPRYIDADALKAKYEQMLPEIGDGYHKETLQDCLFELEYAPTVSPDEVRGVGEWIADSVASNVFRCSICGSDAPICPTGGNEYKSRYCPNCGARMKGAEDGTTD